MVPAEPEGPSPPIAAKGSPEGAALQPMTLQPMTLQPRMLYAIALRAIRWLALGFIGSTFELGNAMVDTIPAAFYTCQCPCAEHPRRAGRAQMWSNPT